MGAPDRTAVLTIGDEAFINEGSELHVGRRVSIGAGCAIAGHVIIRDRDSLNRPGFDGDSASSIHATGSARLLTAVDRFELGRRGVVTGAVEATVIPPVDPRKCRELDIVDRAPGTALGG